MIIAHKSMAPIILSQFISPTAKLKLIRLTQSKHGAINFSGILYMNEKLE